MRFTDFHATGVCTPSRAQLQTGRQGARTGVTSNFQPGSLGGLPQSEKTVASYVKELGYSTCAVGKWHMGVKKNFNPLDHGYDHYLGLPESNDYGCTDTQMGAPDSGCLNWQKDRCPRNAAEAANPPKDWDGTKCHPGPINPWKYSIPLLNGRDIVEQPADLDGSRTGTPVSLKYGKFGAEFIRNSTQAKKPFLLYIAWSHMHVPMVHSKAFEGKSGIGPLGDSLMELDTAAGMVLSALDDAKVADNTIVLLTGDNGPPEDQCDWGGSKGPFVGAYAKNRKHGGGGSSGKITSWEGGHREVGVFRWPGQIQKGSISHALASTMDCTPTIVALAGGQLPTDRTFDGMDMAPVLFKGAKKLHDNLFFSVGGEVYNTKLPGQSRHNPSGALFESVRTTRYSAMYKVGYGAQCCRSSTTGDANTPYNSTCSSPFGALGYAAKWLPIDAPLLFDMSVDVGQETPLVAGSAAHGAALKAIQAALQQHNASLHDGKLQSVPSYKADLKQKACCNSSNVVCRCTELP